MKAAVTGGTGFVGSHLIDALLRRNVDLTALVRSVAKGAPLTPRGVTLVPGDLQTPVALDRLVAGSDVVFHVAGMVTARSEAEFLRTNREGTECLVAACRRAGVSRLVYVSSMAAGGPSAPGSPRTGSEPADPVTAYGRSKLAGESAVRDSGLAWTILRPPMVYGPRDTEVLKVFRLARRGLGPVFGSGRQELSAVTGPDLAEALLAAAGAEATVGRTYYPCHEEVFTSEGFVRAVGEALGRSVRLLHVPPWLGRALLTVTGAAAGLAGRATLLTRDKANEFFQPAWTGDPRPLAVDARWHASRDLSTGLAETVAWYRSAGWL